MPFTGPLPDRAAIRALHASYADATCRGDRESWIACWNASGVWDTAFGRFTGHDDLRAQWDRLWSAIDAMTFVIDVDAISITGDTATSLVRCREIVGMTGGSVRTYTARYDDHLLRDGTGTWRFTRRCYTLLMPECSR